MKKVLMTFQTDEDDRQRIHKAAAKAGMSTSEYIRLRIGIDDTAKKASKRDAVKRG